MRRASDGSGQRVQEWVVGGTSACAFVGRRMASGTMRGTAPGPAPIFCLCAQNESRDAQTALKAVADFSHRMPTPVATPSS